jgi:hypothetical protein
MIHSNEKGMARLRTQRKPSAGCHHLSSRNLEISKYSQCVLLLLLRYSGIGESCHTTTPHYKHIQTQTVYMCPILYLLYCLQCHSFNYLGPQFMREHYLQQVMSRVPHRYTTGWIFSHRTRTHAHHNPLQVIPIPYCNSHGVKRNPRFFFYLSYSCF